MVPGFHSVQAGLRAASAAGRTWSIPFRVRCWTRSLALGKLSLVFGDDKVEGTAHDRVNSGVRRDGQDFHFTPFFKRQMDTH
jgi:hypothetical protein